MTEEHISNIFNSQPSSMSYGVFILRELKKNDKWPTQPGQFAV